MDQASPHFSFAELTATSSGLANEPGENERAALVRLANTLLEPIREMVGPIKINSGYRSPAVNAAVGGVSSSQHLKGEAADMSPVQVSPAVLFDLVESSSLPYDQLILEFGWVHVSCAPEGKQPRRKALKAERSSAGITYHGA